MCAHLREVRLHAVFGCCDGRPARGGLEQGGRDPGDYAPPGADGGPQAGDPDGGDRKFDVLGAKACGIACAGVEFFGYAAPGELAESGAVAVVRTPEELEQFILTH